MENAAAGRIQVFPHVILAPAWARTGFAPLEPASDPDSFRAYVQAVVERYGPRGSFWAEHPELPRLPIRHWQFWNEPHLPYQWTLPRGVDWAPSYTRQLKVFHEVVKATDPGAKVVLGGLTNESWIFLERLYDAGAGPYFDLATLHPYTRRASGVVELVRRFRAVLRRHGHAGRPVWITEFGRPAARGRSKSRNKLKTTDRGMAEFLAQSYDALARALKRRVTRAPRVYWYTWASPYRGDIMSYTGLFRYRRGSAPRKRPALGAYVKTARRLEGCVKSTTGACR
jgi:hypothetical protein